MKCKHDWKNRDRIEYGEYCGNPNVYLLQCNSCKEVKILRGILKEDTDVEESEPR